MIRFKNLPVNRWRVQINQPFVHKSEFLSHISRLMVHEFNLNIKSQDVRVFEFVRVFKFVNRFSSVEESKHFKKPVLSALQAKTFSQKYRGQIETSFKIKSAAEQQNSTH